MSHGLKCQQGGQKAGIRGCLCNTEEDKALQSIKWREHGFFITGRCWEQEWFHRAVCLRDAAHLCEKPGKVEGY